MECWSCEVATDDRIIEWDKFEWKRKYKKKRSLFLDKWYALSYNIFLFQKFLTQGHMSKLYWQWAPFHSNISLDSPAWLRTETFKFIRKFTSFQLRWEYRRSGVYWHVHTRCLHCDLETKNAIFALLLSNIRYLRRALVSLMKNFTVIDEGFYYLSKPQHFYL